jgi:hypothetical protein
MRMFYGAGDYGRAMAGVQMARGYYPGGGFFDFAKKAIGAVSAVSKIPILGSALKAVPVLGSALSLAGMASDVIGGLGAKAIQAGGVQQGPSTAAVKQLAAAGVLRPAVTPGGGLLPRMLVEAGGRPRSRRRRRSSSRRRSTGRTSRRRRRAGDYGDDWSGNKPSRAKGSGQFLTRDGGRRRRRSKRRSRRAGQRVSFTTKSGKRVSFTAKGDGDAHA